MVKKAKKKNLSSSDKKDKLNKHKPARDYDDDEEENIDEEEEEEMEGEEEEENSFIAKDDEEESNDEEERNNAYNRNLYLNNEKIFRERDKKEAKKKLKKDAGESEKEEEEDEKEISIDEKEQEEAEMSENLNDSELEVIQEKKQKKRRKLHKVRDTEEYRRELDDLKDDIQEDNYQRKDSVSNKSQDENSQMSSGEKNRNNYEEFPEARKEKRRNKYYDDFIDDGEHPRPRRDRGIAPSGKTQLLMQEYISEEDQTIINGDYPERLLARYKIEDLPTLSQEIKSEVEWICELKNYNDSPNKKKKITTLLELYKKDFLDIPYIITYKIYLFDDLQKKELWEIFELDKEYQKLMDLKKKVINSFNSLEPFLNEKIYHNMKEKCIDNAKTIQDLKNMMNYISYNKEKYLSSKVNSENEFQGPIKKSVLNVYYSENLDKCAKQFCLDSNDIAFNLELIRNKEEHSKLLRPPEPFCSITELFQNCIPSNMSENSEKSNISQTKVMDNLCYLIGKEMINHPYIKEFVYEYFRNNCYVYTNPTEEGKKQLDVFHPSFRTKRIRERPIKTFNDDLFLDVIQREKEKLIEVNIEIEEKEEELKEFRYYFTQALNSESNIMENNIGIKQEKDDENNYNNNGDKSDWYIFRESVIKSFFESITKQFKNDIKQELREKAESYVINICSENFYRLLMNGPYVVKLDDLRKKKKKEEKTKKKSKNNANNEEKSGKNKKNNNNNEENETFDETDAVFKDEKLPKVMSFVYDPSDNCTYCVVLNQNGELIDQKTFNFTFKGKNRSGPRQNQNQDNNKDSLSQEQKSCQDLIQHHEPNLIVIGANDLKCNFIKEKITDITDIEINYVSFGDLSVPTIYSNSPISESEFPKQNMYIKQAISLGRYQQNPLQEILQLWKEDINENYCLKIKLHPMQKYVNQYNLMEKMENKAIEVVNLCGFDINKAFEFRHLRNTLMFISGFGPRKAKAFIKNLFAVGKPDTRQDILDEKDYGIGPKLGESFINFIKIKTDITSSNIYNQNYELLDMTRIPLESYNMAKKLINDVFKKEENKDNKENNKKQKKKTGENEEKIVEILRYPEKLNILDINEYIKKQSENLKSQEFEQLKFTIKLIKDELSNPFRDLREIRKDLNINQIFHLLIGDENFKEGMITVARVISIDKEHVQCKLQNDLGATVWFEDIFDNSSENEKVSKEKVKALFKPGSTFEARIKSIDYKNYKADLMTKPSGMRSHKDYIPNVDAISNFFELTEEDKLNLPYINAHMQKNKKYQPRNIKFEKFKNMSYTDCCNYLRNKDIGECVFRPSSLGNNNLTLSYKFYKQIICHLDINEEDKLPGEIISKKLRISNEVYSSLDEILKRYVIPCAQLIKESIKYRKFVHCDTKNEFENMLKEEKKKQTSIINYNFTILKDYPGYIVLGYVPKVNPIYEYIKVKPKGLYFHEKSFSSLDEITNYFKKEYSTEKYREMVRKSVIPTVQYHRSLESHNNNLDDSGKQYYNYSIGSSMGLKEGNNYGSSRKDDNICYICKKPGHIAKNCKNRDNYGHDRRRDNRNSGHFIGGKRNRDNRDRNNKDNNDYRKDRNDRGFDGWSRDHGNDNRKIKKDDDGWGNDSNSNSRKKDNDDVDNFADNWGSDNNENNNNIKSENNKNDDDW